mmetsp:Transcript_44212/g.102116  ORF Transcript_44212/g.102116 Transcript_44212/m.102116 type:complete len:104 (-) Transcript_44212:109-420(-)
MQRRMLVVHRLAILPPARTTSILPLAQTTSVPQEQSMRMCDRRWVQQLPSYSTVACALVMMLHASHLVPGVRILGERNQAIRLRALIPFLPIYCLQALCVMPI